MKNSIRIFTRIVLATLYGKVLFLFVLFLTGTSFAETYTYDDIGRLTNVTYTDGSSITYTYDPNGNILSKQVVITDSDGDGLIDSLETGLCPHVSDADSDEDGLLDGEEDSNHNGTVDVGETDPCNPDSDNDGIQDGTEMGLTLADIDPLQTDTNIFIPDADPLTTTDPLDPDSDGDGRTDGEEDVNFNGRLDQGETDPGIQNTWGLPWIILFLSSLLEKVVGLSFSMV